MLTQYPKKTSSTRGSSTLEFVIQCTAVIVTLIVFLGPAGLFATAYNASFGSATDTITAMSTRLVDSLATSDGSPMGPTAGPSPGPPGPSGP